MRAIPAGSAMKVRITGSRRPMNTARYPQRERNDRPSRVLGDHENPAAVAFDERTSAVAADFVGDERADVATDGAGGRRPRTA